MEQKQRRLEIAHDMQDNANSNPNPHVTFGYFAS
jgi:hypothetical protein